MNATRTLPSADELRSYWRESPRWRGVTRDYKAEDVVRLRGTVPVEHSIARITAEKLWRYINEKPFVNSLGALTGNQALQQVKAGLMHLPFRLAGRGRCESGRTDVSGPVALSGRLGTGGRALHQQCPAPCRSDLSRRGDDTIDWLKPIVADAEAGFGGVLNAFELMKGMIEAGAAGVHFEDQLSSAKKCGHMGGKVLVPTQEGIQKLQAARLAADVCNVPTVLLARTDAESATLITSDVDERDSAFIDSSKGARRKASTTSRRGSIRQSPAVFPMRRMRICSGRNRQAGPGGGAHFCRSDSSQVPGQATGLQLFALVQLEAQAR